MATGGTNGAKWSSIEVCDILTGRDVILYPDLGCYELWQDKSKLIKALTHSFKISDLLGQHATENDKKNGLDIADYFIRCDEDYSWALSEGGYPLFWDR